MQAEAASHIEPDLTVRRDVRPEQRGQAAPILGGQPVRPRLAGEGVVAHESVDVDQGGLQDAQAQHG